MKQFFCSHYKLFFPYWSCWQSYVYLNSISYPEPYRVLYSLTMSVTLNRQSYVHLFVTLNLPSDLLIIFLYVHALSLKPGNYKC